MILLPLLSKLQRLQAVLAGVTFMRRDRVLGVFGFGREFETEPCYIGWPLLLETLALVSGITGITGMHRHSKL